MPHVASPYDISTPARVPVNSLGASHRSRSTKRGDQPSSKRIPDAYLTRGTEGASIPCLREALHSLNSKMASLMSQREELESHLNQAVRLQSPVLRLPSELLSSIFVIGVSSVDDDEDSDPLMVSTLMLVCRYWADVTLNTPVLWSTISISTHDSLEKARRKLVRSKAAPLDITINFSPRVEHNGGVTEHVIHAMDLVRPALWRTKSFRLSVPNRPQAHAALLRCQEDAPLLEFLSIRIFHSMQEDSYSNPPLPLFKGHTPRLRSCSFTSFNFGWDIRVISRLRVLKLGGYFNGFSPSVDVLVRILRQCPELEEFALRNMSDIDPDACVAPEDDINSFKVLRLPRLIKASFYYAGITRTRMLFSQVSFPALESIEFCYLDNMTSVLGHLQTQSLTSLPLRYLRIESSFFNELKFVKLLRRLPSLVTLELVDVEDASSNFLKGLSAPSTAQAWICPKLETLNLDGCTALDWDSLRTFIESRLPAHSPTYQRQYTNNPSRFPLLSVPISTSSASAAAAASAYTRGRINKSAVLVGPRRLRSIDVTRCHQISKEMVQWLRMYVADVRCEPAKGVWGEPVMP